MGVPELQADVVGGGLHRRLLHDPAHVYHQGSEEGGTVHEEVRRPHEERGRLHVLRLDDPGRQAFCREAYVDAAAVQAHLENIGAAVGEMLDSGAASLDKIEFHGPKEGWPTFKKTA